MRLLAPFIFAVLESTWALPSGSDLPHNVLEYLVDEGYINIFHDWCNEENSKICEHLIISEESYKFIPTYTVSILDLCIVIREYC